MVETENGAFLKALDTWAGRYPGIKLEKRHCEGYWIALQFFSLETVTEALHRAADASPRYIPNASSVREHCIQFEREKRNERAAQIQEQEAEREGVNLNVAPKIPAMQEQYIEAAGTPLERLARVWECESVSLGLDPNRPTPKDISARRMREFWRTFSPEDVGRDLTTKAA